MGPFPPLSGCSFFPCLSFWLAFLCIRFNLIISRPGSPFISSYNFFSYLMASSSFAKFIPISYFSMFHIPNLSIVCFYWLSNFLYLFFLCLMDSVLYLSSLLRRHSKFVWTQSWYMSRTYILDPYTCLLGISTLFKTI